jgi:4-hydroxy-2-oxoheptanedioate aldolase
VLSAEIMARAGWDALTVDLQHGMADYTAMTAMLAVVGQTPTVPLVRVPWNDPAHIMRALDAGALGVICPMIETPEDARRFAAACLYPPEGGRSFGPIRARLVHGDGYPAAANRFVLPIAMIETRAAVESLDAIAAIPGLAGLYIGPSDLASNLGFRPGFDRREPELLDVIRRIRDAAKANGLAACLHCGAPDYAAEFAGEGFDLVTISSDARFVEAGAKAALERFRAG